MRISDWSSDVCSSDLYEGVDQRVLEVRDVLEVSVGDYVLSGGEPAALVLMDAVVRLLPGVMGNEESPDEESFGAAGFEGFLEYPLYPLPAEWPGRPGIGSASCGEIVCPSVQISGVSGTLTTTAQGFN